LTQVLVAAGVLFVIAYLGNRISFSNRLVNALVTALIFAIFYGALALTADRTLLPGELQQVSRQTWLQMIAISAALVFVLDFIANLISFRSRFVSALVTSLLFALLFAGALYSTKSVPPQKSAQLIYWAVDP
jgi:hypothetical protein